MPAKAGIHDFTIQNQARAATTTSLRGRAAAEAIHLSANCASDRSILARRSKPSRTLRISDAPRRVRRWLKAIRDRFSLPRGEQDGRGEITTLMVPARETKGLTKVCLVFSLFFFDLSAQPALANWQLVGKDSKVCDVIQSEINHLPRDVSVMDWPRQIHLGGLNRPKWKIIDASQNLNIIQKVIAWYWSRPIGAHFNAVLATQHRWETEGKPLYLHEMAANDLVMQSTQISFGINNINDVTVIRFRIENDPKQKVVLSGPLYNWQYAVVSANGYPSINNTPIASFRPLTGELVTIGEHVLMITTDTQSYSSLVEIFLCEAESEDEAHVIGIYDPCVFKMPSFFKRSN
jgi:hypothetical protein